MSNQNEEKRRSLNASAKTVDEAIELGLTQLGLPRDQVDIEIIKEGKRGVFGLGAEEARVRLTPREQPVVESTPEADIPPSAPAADSPEPASLPEIEAVDEDASPAQAPDKPEAPPAGQESVEEIANRYLTGLLEHMRIEAQVTTRIAPELVEVGEEPPLVLDISGQDLGILIGRRTETLQALQYMVRLMVSKEMRSWQHVVVDVESYRVRRRRSLRQMAKKMAERAVATRKRVVLEAMPAYERRIIHLALKDHPAVFTKSIGGDDNRKVTIIPK